MPVRIGGTVDGRYRQTPYHHHIQAQMGWSSIRAWEDSLRDVLALRYIYEELPSQIGPRLREALNLQTFFSQSAPDLATYIPVPVRKVVGAVCPDRPLPPDHADLTALLASDRESRSILLVAGSGSGKTVAARKAFHDCLVVPPHQTRPVLGDYLPVWINSATPGNQDAISSCDQTTLIEQLILNACELRTLSREGFQCWLDHPKLKLLLFFDLNSWGPEGREKIANALPGFLTRPRYLSSGDVRVGHRAVVAYRSSTAEDGPCERLMNSTEFTKYDLDPLKSGQAEHYLRNIRSFEEEIYRQVGQELPARDIDAEVKFLRKLLYRHTGNVSRNSQYFGTDDADSQSVISTPLLMHFCSLQRGEELAEVRTLSDLYEKVINRHLEREMRAIGGYARDGSAADLSRERIEAAMMRLGVLIQSQSSNSVAVTVAKFRESLLEPESGNPADMLRDEKGWWPECTFWHAASWIVRQYSEQEVNLLQEFSLIQRDARQVRFMHDSFVYYLTARALRYPKQNTTRLTTQWPAQVVPQLREWSGPQDEVAAFLGGLLDTTQFEALFLEMMAGRQDARTAKLVTALTRGAEGRVNAATRLQAEYLRTAGWYGLREPLAFLPEIHASLLTERDDDCRKLANKLVSRMRQEQRTWLRTMHPRHRDNNVAIRYRTDAVTCVAVWTNPQDSGDLRIVSGCSDGTVELWNPETAEVSTIIRHQGSVTCLSVLPDGRVVSGGYDDTMRVCDPQMGTAETIIKHQVGSLDGLAMLPDGRVVSGSFDGKIWVCDPQGGTVQAFVEFDYGVTCSAVLPDGRVALKCDDNTVRLWDPLTGKLQTIIEHEDEATCLAVFPDGRVVSASRSIVRLWDPQTGTIKTIIEYENGVTVLDVTVLEVLPDGCLVSGGRSGVVRLHDLQTCTAKTIKQHEGNVTCLAVLPDGRLVSGSTDNTVQLWNPQKRDDQAIIKHRGLVSSLVVLLDGRVVSASRDNTVRLWDPQMGAAKAIIEHESYVNCLVVLPDGRLVSGSRFGFVRLQNPKWRKVQTIIKHKKSVTCLAVFPDGRVVSGGEEGTVQLWDPQTGTTGTIRKHEDRVTCLAVLPDGSVVSGSRDTIRSGYSLKINHGVVECLAVFPDGHIVWGGSDNTVRLVGWWELFRGHPEERPGGLTLIVHESNVTSLAVLSCGRVVSGSSDKTVRLWDPLLQEVIAVFPTSSAVHCLACSADSSRIYAGLASGEVLILQVESPLR